MNLFSLKGKTAIVIGGGRGIGKAVATGFSESGADVVIASRTQGQLDAAAKEISAQTGGKVVGIAADVSSREGIDYLVAKVAETFGHIDILLNAAGVNVRGSALEFTEEGWDTVQNVQLKAVFLMSQAVAKHMKENEIKGKIINVASLTSVLGLKNMVSYACAKGAVVQLTKVLANELAEYGINVNAFGPGYVKTEMTKAIFDDPERVKTLLSRIPANRFGSPEDMVGAALFLASPASDYVTGQVIYVDGGFLSA
ncbi:MAG TPA: glucose 1-dehydrogenase [Anaerovoracaceae bacterium]|nr:glucose 1-dehydrogenase [Anaerovoracaceae bacterium]